MVIELFGEFLIYVHLKEHLHQNLLYPLNIKQRS
jgi:hypothetical protein